jgi:pectate lyase
VSTTGAAVTTGNPLTAGGVSTGVSSSTDTASNTGGGVTTAAVTMGGTGGAGQSTTGASTTADVTTAGTTTDAVTMGATGAGGSSTTTGSATTGGVVSTGPIGFATLNGGTNGGEGGQVVTVTSYADLKSYAESSTTYIIMVEGTISNGSAGGQINVNSNKSIIGVGSAALLSGVAFNISSKNNIIIQNLRATLVGASTPSSINGGDVIGIQGTSRNIWIDHCELYSEDPSVQTNIDLYDGLIDIKHETGFITISYNYLHDHHKGGLVGAADDDLYDDRKVTYHHNHYQNVRLRVPMYRGSVGHFFNNYIVGASDATEIRAGTCVRVEKNYYEALHYSIYTPADSPGSTERIDNIEVDRTDRAYPGNCTAEIPYSYSEVLTSNTGDIPTLVPQLAGVGKI